MSSGKITRFQNNVRVDGSLDLSNSTGNLTLSSLSSAPSSPTVGDVYYDTTLGKARVYQSTGWTTTDGSAAGSLDAAYNGGASIAVDAGAITLTDSQTNANGAILITKSGVVTGAASDSVLYVNSTGAHDTSGRVSLLHLAMGAETASTPEGARISMNARGDNALKVTLGSITLDDGDLTLSSVGNATTSGFTVTTANTSGDGISFILDSLTSGDGVVIDGDAGANVNYLAVQHGSANVFTVSGTLTTSEQPFVLDLTNAEALLIRKDSDGGDLLTVDSTSDAGDTNVLLTTGVTTGKGLHIDASTITTGQGLRVTVVPATMTSAGAAIQVYDATNAREVFAVRDDGSVYMYGTAEGTTASQTVVGDMLISDGDLTLSGGEVSVTDGVTTTGQGFHLVSGVTTAIGMRVTADAVTSGDILYLDNGGGTMTAGTGYFINANDDNASVFTVSTDGRVVIAGTDATTALSITAGNIVLTNGGITLTETAANQVLLKYDDSNTFGVDVDLDGSTTLTTTGTDADFEIASGTGGDITLDATGDIVMEAGGADITMDAQLTITNTSADQFVIAYDGSNNFGLDVDVDGSTTLTTTGTNADFEIASGTAGDITLDSTGDIFLEAGGSDINADAPLNITVAGGSQLELIASGSIKMVDSVADTTGVTTRTVSGGTTNSYEIVADAVTIDSAGALALESTGVTSDAGITVTKTSGSLFSANYDGSNYLKVEVAADGYATLTTVGTDADFEIASGTGGDIILDATGDVVLEAGGADVTMDAQLTITTAANEAAFVIVNNTITTTGPLMDISSTSLSTASMLKLNANTAANDGKVLEIVSAGDATSTPTGVDVTIASVTSGVAFGMNVTMAGATTQSKGIAVTMDALTEGNMLYLDNGGGSLTSGYFINANDDGAVKFGVGANGATTIAGSASGTDALTLTAGDILISSGHLDMTVGDATLADGSLSVTDADNATSVTVVNDVITTTGPLVDISSTSISTASLMKLNANTAANDGKVLEIVSAGDATSTPTGIDVTIGSPTTGAATGINVTMALATTTAKGIAVTMDALTEGSALYIDNGGASLTTGYFINANDDGAVKFGVGLNGNTTIAGTAAGTDALTLTTGDLFLSDSDQNIIESEDGTNTLLLLDNKAGVIASGEAVLKVDAGGVVDAAGYGIYASFTGAAAAGATVVGVAPDAGSVGIKVIGTGVATAEGLYVDVDPTANSGALIQTEGVLAADKATLELVSNGSGSNADSSTLRVEQSHATGGSMVVTLKQDDIDQPVINFEGASAADDTSVISTRNGDGTVEGPKNFSASAGWSWSGMVRCAINGTDAWIPTYAVDTA